MDVALGRGISSYTLYVFSVRDSFIANVFPEATPYRHSIAVPRGCGVELPISFTYRSRKQLDPKSGWWVLVYAEFAVNAAAFLLV